MIESEIATDQLPSTSPSKSLRLHRYYAPLTESEIVNRSRAVDKSLEESIRWHRYHVPLIDSEITTDQAQLISPPKVSKMAPLSCTVDSVRDRNRSTAVDKSLGESIRLHRYYAPLIVWNHNRSSAIDKSSKRVPRRVLRWHHYHVLLIWESPKSHQINLQSASPPKDSARYHVPLIESKITTFKHSRQVLRKSLKMAPLSCTVDRVRDRNTSTTVDKSSESVWTLLTNSNIWRSSRI